MQASLRYGMARIFVRYADFTNSVLAADEAIRIAPLDPEAHRVRAIVLNRLRERREAAESLESAVSLRYRDDYLWIDLGNTREEIGDTENALAAMHQAVRWAPYYAHTHWQRGNLLLRMQRPSEAFRELRVAATANPAYLKQLIDLAWGISRGDIKTTETLLAINDDILRLDLIRFLARKGEGRDVLDQIRSLNNPLSKQNKDELVKLLFVAKAYRAAYALWRDPDDFKSRKPWFVNGGFEEPFSVDDSAFGWLISPEVKGAFVVDVGERSGGNKSLLMRLDGNWPPGTSSLSQTFLVDPNQKYRISFGAKAKELVTGGPPVLVVYDANTNQLLGKSQTLPSGTTSWVRSSFDFTTQSATEAAVIRLQRENCDSSPCPIFGNLWIDEFVVESAEATKKR